MQSKKPKSFNHVQKIVKKIDPRLNISKNRYFSSYYFYSEDPAVSAALLILQETTVNVESWDKLSIYQWENCAKNIINKIKDLNLNN